MVKNHNLAQAISDVGFGEFRRQLTYKAEMRGCKLVVLDRFYPSSKTCSQCGYKKETLSLNERTFICEHCGCELDRDLNASINLEKQIELNVLGEQKTPLGKVLADVKLVESKVPAIENDSPNQTLTKSRKEGCKKKTLKKNPTKSWTLLGKFFRTEQVYSYTH